MSETEVVVIKAPSGKHELACGGVAMIGAGESAPQDAQRAGPVEGETLVGKRYASSDGSLEVLCVKSGKGTLTFDGQALELRQAKRLPSSD